MKTQFCIGTSVFLSLLIPLVAQTYTENLAGLPEGRRDAAPDAGTSLSPGELPTVDKAQGSPPEGQVVYTAQDSMTLETRLQKGRPVAAVVDLAVLQKPSPFRQIAAGASTVPTDGVKTDLALISAVYRESGKPESNCVSISLSLEQRIKLDDSKLLEMVETEVKANPACSCEIIKTAITASDADVETVVSIVETSIIAAPEMMRIISQCAIATVPESLAGVQSVLAKYDANGGDGGSSAKSAKDSKDAKDSKAIVPDSVAAMPNPLDFPGHGPIGPTVGGPGGKPLLPTTPPIIITPPNVTNVDP
ncbi:MAG: hypothetical protein ABI600_13860 [Luteolibacter sp.]